MNRLRSFTPSSKSLTTEDGEAHRSIGSEVRVESGVASTLSGDAPAVVFAPIHYEPNYAYPLLVWLHGDGANERQLVRLMPQISLRNYVGVAPRGSIASASNAFSWSARNSETAVCEQRVFEAIEGVARRYRLARQRVFLAGAANGGTAALRLALAHPDRFAGALSFGGGFPDEGTPLARIIEARRLPLFMAHDGTSPDFTAERIEQQIRLFYTAGMQVMLRQYPPDSQLGRLMLADADRWMMEIVTGSGPK